MLRSVKVCGPLPTGRTLRPKRLTQVLNGIDVDSRTLT